MPNKEETKRINSREKGKSYELKIAKILSTWWDSDFRRTPNSGGLGWRQDNRVTGDIVTPEGANFPFSVECKKHEDWVLEQVLRGIGDIESWWEQCLRDANKIDVKPFLVFSKNFNPNYLMMLLEDYLSILRYKECKIPISHFIIGVNGKPGRIVVILDDFIRYVSKEDVQKSLYNK